MKVVSSDPLDMKYQLIMLTLIIYQLFLKIYAQ